MRVLNLLCNDMRMYMWRTPDNIFKGLIKRCLDVALIAMLSISQDRLLLPPHRCLRRLLVLFSPARLAFRVL